jgi:hypothetical protein
LGVIFLVRAFSTTVTALSFRLVFLSRLVREEKPVAVPDLLSSDSAAAAALVFRVSRAASTKEMRSFVAVVVDFTCIDHLGGGATAVVGVAIAVAGGFEVSHAGEAEEKQRMH